jgi:putative component of membrane protein insertase Oxa1/YidC/SpoIIIJ protein YidD
MRGGLYQVTTNYLCAGFIVEAGRIVRCAPVLRQGLVYWKTIAVWIGD